ncbi:hypothetical protein G7Z17_g2600 [Cylindrodendrum hubeiense]|uniref:Uncharacterized protein n=1 Tax=Cylindrodendrum hubeiense TaxID=595255 RepID=A0A9P5LJ00_9HYPO|nr:hypothetical protein G7Z17_g2600 [Cylindrodendrum hubeiense]
MQLSTILSLTFVTAAVAQKPSNLAFGFIGPVVGESKPVPINGVIFACIAVDPLLSITVRPDLACRLYTQDNCVEPAKRQVVDVTNNLFNPFLKSVRCIPRPKPQ